MAGSSISPDTGVLSSEEGETIDPSQGGGRGSLMTRLPRPSREPGRLLVSNLPWRWDGDHSPKRGAKRLAAPALRRQSRARPVWPEGLLGEWYLRGRHPGSGGQAPALPREDRRY